MPTSRSPSSSRISRTPCVLRPIDRDIGHRRAHQRAGGADQHELVVRRRPAARRPSRPLRSVVCMRDDALAAAACDRVLLERRELAVAVRGGRQDRPLADDDERDHLVARRRRASCRARPPRRDPSAARRPRGSGSPCRALANSMISRLPSVSATPTSRSSSRRSTAMMPLVRGRENAASGVFLTVPLARRHEHVFVVLECLDGQHGVDPLALFQRQQIHDRLAARAAPGLRQLVDLQPVSLAAAREAQQGVVRVRDEQLLDEILVLHRAPPLARGRRAAAPGRRPPAATWRSPRATA